MCRCGGAKRIMEATKGLRRLYAVCAVTHIDVCPGHPVNVQRINVSYDCQRSESLF